MSYHVPAVIAAVTSHQNTLVLHILTCLLANKFNFIVRYTTSEKGYNSTTTTQLLTFIYVF